MASSGGKSSEEKESLRLLRAAGSIGAISAASKVIGLVREASTAAVFGLGPVRLRSAERHRHVSPAQQPNILAQCSLQRAGCVLTTSIRYADRRLYQAADAYNCALLLPSFVVTVIAGLNGPLHSAVTAVLRFATRGSARRPLIGIQMTPRESAPVGL